MAFEEVYFVNGVFKDKMILYIVNLCSDQSFERSMVINYKSGVLLWANYPVVTMP